MAHGIAKKKKKQIAKKQELTSKFGKDLGIKKYEQYLKRQQYLNYLTYPIKAIKNPKKAIKKLTNRGKNEI